MYTPVVAAACIDYIAELLDGPKLVESGLLEELHYDLVNHFRSEILTSERSGLEVRYKAAVFILFVTERDFEFDPGA